jgi:hypothetical protein
VCSHVNDRFGRAAGEKSYETSSWIEDWMDFTVLNTRTEQKSVAGSIVSELISELIIGCEHVNSVGFIRGGVH